MDDPSIQTELQFPCEFPLKVIGHNNEEFTAEVTRILVRHVPELEIDAITSRLSSGDKYRSLSTVFIAQSRPQVDALYIELTAHPLVLWVL